MTPFFKLRLNSTSHRRPQLGVADIKESAVFFNIASLESLIQGQQILRGVQGTSIREKKLDGALKPIPTYMGPQGKMQQFASPFDRCNSSAMPSR